MIINLREFTRDDHPFGNVQGQEVFQKLREVVEQNKAVDVYGISLEGIEATDASFPRESVMALAKTYRCEKGFFLLGMEDQDLLDNWLYAASAKTQPLVAWLKNGYQVLGPEMTKATQSLVSYILDNGSVTTSQVSDEFNLSIPNASTRLKKLYNSGYVLREEEVADTGGKEFVYKAIKFSD